MSVAANSALTSTNVNTAFASKSANNTLTGVQTFSGATIHNAGFSGDLATDSSTTGSNQTLSLPNFFVRLTNASLTSVCGITAPSTSRIVCVTNFTGAAITIVNDATATAANRIITGSAADLSVANTASIFLFYDTTSSRWRIIGGSGGGSTSWDTSSQQTLSGSGAVTISLTKALQMAIVAGNGAAVTLSSTPFGSTDAADGAVIHLIGASDTNTVTITANDAANGCVGNFSSITLAKYDSCKFQYSSTLDRWVLI